MRTTIDIDDANLERLKEQARKRKRPLKSMINEALRFGLAKLDGANRPRARFKVESSPIGVKEEYRGISANQLFDRLETDEGGGARSE